MFNSHQAEEIKKIIREFFSKTSLEVEIEFASLKEETLSVNLKTPNPQILIGEGGQTLLEIQHLLKSILKRKIQDNFYIDLDINNYKKRKIEYLKELARSMADEVALAKKEKILSPMPAYDRRVIHLELAEREDISTESVGEEPDRRIIIKPKP